MQSSIFQLRASGSQSLRRTEKNMILEINIEQPLTSLTLLLKFTSSAVIWATSLLKFDIFFQVGVLGKTKQNGKYWHLALLLGFQDLKFICMCSIFNVLEIKQLQWPFKNISTSCTAKLSLNLILLHLFFVFILFELHYWQLGTNSAKFLHWICIW